jgi:hypothetical protein
MAGLGPKPKASHRSSSACTRLTTPPSQTPLRPPSGTTNISCCRHRSRQKVQALFTLPFPFPLSRRVSRESHKGTHLAVGGFDVSGKGDIDVIEGTTGDIGENGTASFDPFFFFFFHHAFIDYVFGSGNRGTTRPLARHYSRISLHQLGRRVGTHTRRPGQRLA